MLNTEEIEKLERIKKNVAKLFFLGKDELTDELEVEIKKGLKEAGLPFTLTILKAMLRGMELYQAGAKIDHPGRSDLATISEMFIISLICREEEKLEKIVENNLS